MTRRVVLLGIELAVAVLLLAVAGLFYASYYIDTREFRTLFTDTLSRATGREVRLVGELNLNIWPEILLEVGGLTVGEDPAFGDEPFARFETVHVNVLVLPLLANSVQVESVYVDGLHVALKSDADDRLNVESLVRTIRSGSGAAVSGDWTFSLSNIEVVNTDVLFEDGRKGGEEGGRWQLSGISLRTGDIRPGVPIPLTVGSGFSSGELGLGADFSLSGLVSFNADLTDLRLDDATLTATVSGDFLPEDARPGELTSRVTFDWERRTVALDEFQARLLGLRAEGSLKSGDLRNGLSADGHVALQPFTPATLIARYAPDSPMSSVDGLKSGAFASFFHIDDSGVRFEKLVATLDDITVRGDLDMRGFVSPVFDFVLRSSTIDLDRYLPLLKTGTPFVWDDFNLPLFRAFKGRGTVRADGVAVRDIRLSDIRLKVSADESIVIDGGAVWDGQTSVGGTLSFAIGEGADGNPTLGLKADIDAESGKDGFSFIEGDAVSLGGAGVIRLDCAAPPASCPLEMRSMELLNRLEGSVELSLLNGRARFKTESGKVLELPYNELSAKADASPGSGPEAYWNPVMAVSLRTRGGREVRDLTVDAQGPVSLAWDGEHLVTDGMSVNAAGFLSVLPEGARRVSASARIAYDTKTYAAGVENGFIRVLDTTATGSGEVTGLDDDIKGSGEFSVKEANPRRIIKLLTGEDFPTADPEALGSWSLAAQVSADGHGFTLSEAKADIDGMPVTGHVVGNGYADPMLSFSLTGGKLDIDRYLPPKAERSLEERRSGKYVKAPPVRLPLRFLRALRLNGKAVLEELKLAKARSRGVTGDITADKGRIHVARIRGTSYGGDLNADWSGRVNPDYLTTELDFAVKGFDVGAMTRDLGGKDYVRGLGNVNFDLASRGTTDDDILLNLEGKVTARVTNGSFKFSGYPQEGEIRPGTLSKQEIAKMEQRARARTSFRRASAEFTVRNGVFTADKFRVEAPPVLQSYGRGGFSLPDNSIDLSIQNDFVVVPSVTLVLSGRLTDPEVDIPTGDILNDTVLNILSIPKKSFEFLRDLF